jgi:hypothetical protein
MSKDKIVKGGMKLASKFKSDLRQQHKDLMSYPDAGEIASLKRRGGDSPSKSINNAFNYIEKSKTPAQAKSRSEEMFGEFDLDTAIEEAGGFDKAFKVKPVKKKMGGIVKAAKKVAKKVFPDLNKDGKVTQKDILIGKGVLKKKTAATKKAKSEGNPMRDMVNESASAKAADKARRKKNRRIAAEAIGGATAMGVAGTIAYKADKAAEAADRKKIIKKPVKKANGGMLNSPAAVKRRSGAAVKGFKKGGMATKWESKWG